MTLRTEIIDAVVLKGPHRIDAMHDLLFRAVLGSLLLASLTVAGACGQSVTPDTAREAITQACRFYSSLAKHGGYVWRYSRDKRLSEGEAETDEHTIWVQPPGTPTVGEAYLDAFEATRDQRFLEFAQQAAVALVHGQLQSGGWYYSIHFDPAERARRGYRSNSNYRPRRRGRDRNNITTLDDDTTQAALRFLMRFDRAADGASEDVREAINFGLAALIAAQAPNGGWRQNWDRYPQPLSASEYPVVKASFPETWLRSWDNKWTGKYYLNDDVMGKTIATMLDAWDAYGDDRYLQSAKRGGDFLILAQMPDPQPAWAQQYDEHMHPVWDRKFEPPAISGAESRFAIRALLMLAERTSDTKYLKPIPRALAYLRQSEVAPGRLARFYELRTNKPLYFEKDTYKLTYDASNLPTHYSFVADSGLESLQREYDRVRSGKRPTPAGGASRLEPLVRGVIDSQEDAGGWLDERGMRGFRKASQEGVYQSETFARNVSLLARYLKLAR